jgi:hypothetical protein
LAGTGIRRNPEESIVNAGIPVLQAFSAKKSCERGKKQEFLRPPPKPRSCEKILRKTQEKKKSSGILFFTVLSPKNIFLSNRNYQPSIASFCI